MVVALVKLRYARISNKKALCVSRKIKGMSYNGARDILYFSKTKASVIFYKLLMSCLSNLLHKNVVLDKKSVVVKSVIVNKAPMLKKRIFRSKGSVNKMLRRCSHISITLSVD